VALSELGPAQSLAEGLEAQFQAAQIELDRVHAAEAAICRKADRLESAFTNLTQLAAELSGNMRNHAQELSSCIQGSLTAPAADNPPSPAPSTAPAAAAGSIESAVHTVDLAKPDMACRSLLATTRRAPLQDVSWKENVSPCQQSGRRRSSGSSAARLSGDGSPPRRISPNAAGGALTTGGELKRRRIQAEFPPRFQPEVDDDPLESATPPVSFRPIGHPAPTSAVTNAPLSNALAAAVAHRARPRLCPGSGATVPMRPKTVATMIEDLCSPDP